MNYNIPFIPADILIPKKGINMNKWSVVACDQFTSDPAYWEDVNRIVGDEPSSLRLILPEVYLDAPESEAMIKSIRENMEKYVNDGIFRELTSSMIYTERTDSTGKLRCGVIGAVDLEQYDFRKGSTSPIRATEATVAERIPPRIRIREGALLELPHIMILIDDPEKTVIEKISSHKDSLELLYDTDLMKNGGRITGRLMDRKTIDDTLSALAALGEKDSFEKRSGVCNVPLLLFAMGDGNHSLATAKEYYERLKRENPGKDLSSHPARYALCEIVNLHSDALEFEAIHRIVTDTDTGKLLSEMTAALSLSETPLSGCTQHFDLVTAAGTVTYYIGKPSSDLTVGSVQNFLDGFLSKNCGKTDYIHGKESLIRLAQREGAAGFILPAMKKEELFPAVIRDGALPRKTFSMGHAEDKRYYLEARRIK